jgi:rhamnogalacturonan endolyase
MKTHWSFALFYALSVGCVTCAGADLFRDDFARYPSGWLSNPQGGLGEAVMGNNQPIQEYHYIADRGVPLGPWENAICHLDSWMVSDEEGKPYLEEQFDSTARHWTNPILITGDPEWNDYSVEVKVKPLTLKGMAGIAFRYHTNRHYYSIGLSGGNKVTLALRLPLEVKLRKQNWKELATAEFHYDTKRYYVLKVETEGANIRAYVDGAKLLEATDSEILHGKAGLTTSGPARFQEFRAWTSDAKAREIAAKVRARDHELARLRQDNPKPVLWKKFDTPGFGAGRNTRFGDLDGDGVADMLIAQNIPRIRADAFDQISCLTAVNLEGKILWQVGKPDPRNTLLTNDTPFQIHDIDGDGKNEVVTVRDFKLQVLDGRTGKVRQWVWMPQVPPAEKERPYELEAGDSIAFVNFSGNRDRREILVKDRYRRFWIYSNKLELLWTGEGQTGHYPYPVDLDGKGRDSLMIGYALWNHLGEKLWSHDTEVKDHADGIAVANLSADPKAEPRVYASGSDEGLIMFDIHGKMLKHVLLGHNQSPSIGHYRTDLPGLQYISVNYWGSPGIVTLFDWDANILAQEEPIHSGSPMLPVNWRGDGQEFCLLSGHVKEGGMIDGRLRRVVMFPDDGHPDLAVNALDLTGDQRDEIVLWDTKRVWIYTQDQPFRGKRIYAPARNPDFNESNYRTNVSLPAWEDVKIRK